MSKCEFCGKEHDGSYGTGRFCSPTCARKYSNTFVSETGRENQIKALNNEKNRKKAIENNKHKQITKFKSKSKKKYRNDLNKKFKHPLMLGKAGELEVAKKFIQHGYNVYTPLTDAGDGIDLVVNNGTGFKTIQVKSTSSSNINENMECESSSFSLYNIKRNIHNGTYTQIKNKYSKEEVNYFALYSAYDDESYLLENNDNVNICFTIRNQPPKNNQANKIHYAADYQIDKVLDELNLIKGVYYEDNIIDGVYKEIE